MGPNAKGVGQRIALRGDLFTRISAYIGTFAVNEATPAHVGGAMTARGDANGLCDPDAAREQNQIA